MENGQEEHELEVASLVSYYPAVGPQPRGCVRTTYKDEHDDEDQLDASEYILELAEDLGGHVVSAEKL